LIFCWPSPEDQIFVVSGDEKLCDLKCVWTFCVPCRSDETCPATLGLFNWDTDWLFHYI